MQKILEGFDFKVPSYVFTPDDFKRMASAVELETLEKKFQVALQFECVQFLALVASWTQAPRPTEVRKYLENVHSDVARLMDTLHSLGEADAHDQPARKSASALLHLADLNNDWADKDATFANFLAFTERLTDIGKAAKDAISYIPEDLGGRPADFPLDQLVNRMAELFTGISEHRATVTTDPYADLEDEIKGKFLDFVEEFLRPLVPHYQISRRTLGVSVKRVLRARKRS